jgi:Lrp/AsnC family transcriptional regulator for asnA, asnC and gidA
MINGKSNKEISQYLSIPLSTIQRRTRHLFASGIIISRVKLDYEKLGYKTGLLHIYLKNGNINAIAKRINELEGVTSIEIHIGNSDILTNVVYKDGKKLLLLVSEIKNFDGVERIVWSERVYRSPHKDIDVDLDL